MIIAQPQQKNRVARMMLLMLPACMLVLDSPMLGQKQTYVTRFDAFGGYAFLDSSNVSLFENGFAAQIGVRPRTWYSLGFDYTFATGDLTLTPDLLLPEIQQTLGAQLKALAAAGRLPPGYSLTVPSHSRTQTFAAGPQLAYRHWEHATIFFRPVFAGAIYEVATPKPGDPIATAIVAQLAPSGKKTNTTWFLGLGGGFDIILTHHVAIRTQADVVYDHLFNDLLKDGRWTVRFSVGPAFNFGKNIVK